MAFYLRKINMYAELDGLWRDRNTYGYVKRPNFTNIEL